MHPAGIAALLLVALCRGEVAGITMSVNYTFHFTLFAA